MSPFTADDRADLIEQRSLQLASCLEKKHPKKMQHLDNVLNKIFWKHCGNRMEEPIPSNSRRSSKSICCSSQCSTRCPSIDGNPQFAQDVHLHRLQHSVEAHPGQVQPSADVHPHQTHFPKDTQRAEYDPSHMVTLPNLKADCFAERRRCVYSPLNTKAKPAWSDDWDACKKDWKVDDFQFLCGPKKSVTAFSATYGFW